MCTRRAVRRLLRICNAYGGVAGTWVLIPCIVGTTFRRTDEKLGAETGDFVMSYKSVVAAVGMSLRAVGSGDIIVLCIACMYAFSNVLREKLLKQNCTEGGAWHPWCVRNADLCLAGMVFGMDAFRGSHVHCSDGSERVGFSDVLLRYV